MIYNLQAETSTCGKKKKRKTMKTKTKKIEKKNNHYVYAILDPGIPVDSEYCGIHFDREPFYIGSGTLSRMFFFTYYHPCSSNQHVYDRIFKIMKEQNTAPLFIKLKAELSLQDSLDIEKELITKIGRTIDGGPLVNKMLGSTGNTGHYRSKETKAKMSKSLIGRKVSEETKKLIGQTNKGVRIMATDLENNFIGIYPTISDAARELDVKATNIRKYLQNKIKRVGKYEFTIVPKERIF